MRTVVIHYHLFKNAGSTVDDALLRTFGDRHGAIEGPYPWTTVSPERLGRYIKEHPEIDAVSSHQARLPLPLLDGTSFIPVLFLRHPLDRFVSVYEYERRTAKDSLSPSAAVAQSCDLRAFAEWAVSPAADAVVRNYQTTHVAGIDHDMRKMSASRFHQAIAQKRLERLPCVGVVDRFDESMARFSALISTVFPQFSGTYEIQNVSSGRSDTLKERLDETRQHLGDELYRRLTELNRLDLDLYQRACQRLDQTK